MALGPGPWGVGRTTPTALTALNFAAGTTSVNTTAISFSNANGVSFGINSGTITASVAAAAAGSINFSAGLASANVTNIVFSDSNGLAFGLNGSTITGSYTVPTQTSLVFSNSNNVSFGVNGSTVTASASVATSLSNIKVSAGTSSTNLSALTFSDGSGVSWGLNGSVVTASVAAIPTPTTNSYWMNENYENMNVGGALTKSSGSSIYLQPLFVPYNISHNFVRLLVSCVDSNVGTAGTTSANTTYSVQRYTTVCLVLYSNGVGANSRSLQYLSSTSQGMTNQTLFSMAAVGGSSGYTIHISRTFPVSGVNSNYGTSYASNSASIVIAAASTSLFAGFRWLDIGWANSIAPGAYWIGIGESTASASNSSNISFAGTVVYSKALVGATQSNVSAGVMGIATIASDNNLVLGGGVWTTNASIFSTSSIAFSDINQAVSNPIVPIQFIRQA